MVIVMLQMMFKKTFKVFIRRQAAASASLISCAWSKVHLTTHTLVWLAGTGADRTNSEQCLQFHFNKISWWIYLVTTIINHGCYKALPLVLSRMRVNINITYEWYLVKRCRKHAAKEWQPQEKRKKIHTHKLKSCFVTGGLSVIGSFLSNSVCCRILVFPERASFKKCNPVGKNK